MNVLFLIDHAPDYREEFFRCLGEKCNLTVVSHPCEPDGLSNPFKRINYHYIELQNFKIGPFLYANLSHVHLSDYDVICADLNPRHFWRFLLFLKDRSNRKKWIWWGHIYGRSNNVILNFMRRQFLIRSAAILAYSKSIANRARTEAGNVPVLSINNSQTKKEDFLVLEWPDSEDLHFIFVGRPQKRKRLDRILRLAESFPNTKWRLIGPDMYEFIHKNFDKIPNNIECFGKTTGPDLEKHFSWCHAVVNPGHLGLLVSNAALHGRPVLIQKNENHAPEIALAEDSNQLFLDFDNIVETEIFFTDLRNDYSVLKEAAQRLQKTAKSEYTIEHMVEKHMEAFKIAYSERKKINTIKIKIWNY